MPDMSSTIVRGHLQTSSLSYQNQAFVWSEVFPRLVLPTSKSKVPIFNRGDQFRDEAKIRARGTVTPTLDYKFDTVDLNTFQYASKHDVTKEDLREAGIPDGLNAPIDMKMEAIERNSEKLELSIEKQVATLIREATWEDGNSGGEDADAKWTASSGNTFLEDVDKGMDALRSAGIPLTEIRLAMDFKTFQGVRKFSDIATRTQYTKDIYPSAESIANYLMIDKVVVAGGIYSSANENAAGTDFTSVDIWGGTKGYAFLYHYPKRIGLKSMSAGYTCFNKMENGQEKVTYQWYDNDSHSWRFESQIEVGPAIVCADAGYAWTDTHTT